MNPQDTGTNQSIVQTGSVQNINWAKVLIAVIALAIFGGLCFWVGHEIPARQSYTSPFTNSKSNNTSASGATTTPTSSITPSTPTPTPVPSGSMQTYTNAQYTFKFQYPSDYAVTPTNSLTIQPPFYGQPIVSVENPSGTYELSNYKQYSIFSVDQSSNTSGCYTNPQDGSAMTTTKTINGTTYHYATTTSGAAGTHVTTTAYRTIKGNMCFDVMQVVVVSSDYNNIDNTKAQAGINDANSALDQILSSFSFS